MAARRAVAFGLRLLRLLDHCWLVVLGLLSGLGLVVLPVLILKKKKSMRGG